MEIKDTNIAAYLLSVRDKNGKPLFYLASTRYDPDKNIVYFNIAGASDSEIRQHINKFFREVHDVFAMRRYLLDIVFQQYGIKPKYFAPDYSIIPVKTTNQNANQNANQNTNQKVNQKNR
ncbi:MAG: hypothetical protein ABIK73_06730 [candidate division WOR-3 bacterium]